MRGQHVRAQFFGRVVTHEETSSGRRPIPCHGTFDFSASS